MSSTMLAAHRTEEQKLEDNTTLPSNLKYRLRIEKAAVDWLVFYVVFKTPNPIVKYSL